MRRTVSCRCFILYKRDDRAKELPAERDSSVSRQRPPWRSVRGELTDGVGTAWVIRKTTYSSFIRKSSQPDRAASAKPKHEPNREAPEAAFGAVKPVAERGAAERQKKDKQAARQDHAADDLRDVNSRPIGVPVATEPRVRLGAPARRATSVSWRAYL